MTPCVHPASVPCMYLNERLERTFAVYFVSASRFTQRLLLITPMGSSVKLVNINKQYVLMMKLRQKDTFSPCLVLGKLVAHK